MTLLAAAGAERPAPLVERCWRHRVDTFIASCADCRAFHMAPPERRSPRR